MFRGVVLELILCRFSTKEKAKDSIFAGFGVAATYLTPFLVTILVDEALKTFSKRCSLNQSILQGGGGWGTQEMMFSSAKSLLLSLSRLPLPVTCCYITELSHMSKSQQLDA